MQVFSAIASLFRDPDKGLKKQIKAMQDQQMSDQGRALAEQSKSQAEIDMESSGLRKPGRGRRMLEYGDTGGATYGG